MNLTAGTTPWTGDQPVASLLPAQENAITEVNLSFERFSILQLVRLRGHCGRIFYAIVSVAHTLYVHVADDAEATTRPPNSPDLNPLRDHVGNVHELSV
jgi:hypothetical protein